MKAFPRRDQIRRENAFWDLPVAIFKKDSCKFNRKLADVWRNAIGIILQDAFDVFYSNCFTHDQSSSQTGRPAVAAFAILSYIRDVIKTAMGSILKLRIKHRVSAFVCKQHQNENITNKNTWQNMEERSSTLQFASHALHCFLLNNSFLSPRNENEPLSRQILDSKDFQITRRMSSLLPRKMNFAYSFLPFLQSTSDISPVHC